MSKINNFLLNFSVINKGNNDIVTKKTKYVATRKDICAGELISIHPDYQIKIIGSNEGTISENEKPKYKFVRHCLNVCRGMLFNVNENGLANDLIYDTPTNYVIGEIEPKVDIETNFFIDNYIELEELLKYEGYGLDLTQKDLDLIFQKYVTSNFWLFQHMNLFGFQKSSDVGYDLDKSQAIISYDIYERLTMISASKEPDIFEPYYKLINKK